MKIIPLVWILTLFIVVPLISLPVFASKLHEKYGFMPLGQKISH